jgi:hypothetical protein
MLEAKSMRGFASEAASGWPFILSEIPQTNKDSGNAGPT